jgi:hypothetical protein
MVDQFLLDGGPLDEAMIRRWASDHDAYFMPTDDDLVLHEWAWSELLIQLIADPSCPKSSEILNIWEDFTRHTTVHQKPSDIDAAEKAVRYASNYTGHAGLEGWVSNQRARLKYVEGVGPVGRNEALAMGDALLNGANRSCIISVRAETARTIEIEMSVPLHGSHREWLSIDKLTGKFRYSRHWPEGASEPVWFDKNR